MDYYGIGFSNIRLPNDKKSYTYKYDARYNTFPEEVFVHEFIHSLERSLLERKYEIPKLHDNELYGYNSKQKEGLKSWYKAYLTKTIKDKTTGNFVGLEEDVFKMRPVKEIDFKNSYFLELLNEPTNKIEEIKITAEKIMKLFKGEWKESVG